MPEKPSHQMPATVSPEHEEFVYRIWDRLRRTDTSLGMDDLATLTSACSDITQLLKRPKRPVKPMRLRIVR